MAPDCSLGRAASKEQRAESIKARGSQATKYITTTSRAHFVSKIDFVCTTFMNTSKKIFSHHRNPHRKTMAAAACLISNFMP